ncbi:MAG TPA: hypothetical protein VEA38_00830 [Terriglobales bacterium]|nr:hypothetical protein [Terriglobales bacterium]
MSLVSTKAQTHTYREATADARAQLAGRRDELIAEWRARNQWATCSDETAYLLADLERQYGTRVFAAAPPAPQAPPSKPTPRVVPAGWEQWSVAKRRKWLFGPRAQGALGTTAR